MSSIPVNSEAVGAHMVTHRYAEENLFQTYEVYVPEGEDGTATEENGKVWVIYIHGGAWRDPNGQSWTFYPALSLLLQSSSISEHVAGYASINYRLSPNGLQDPKSTPPYELQNAVSPDHIHDIIAGVTKLQQTYGFGSRYVLGGHSAGATLAFQFAMSSKIPWSPSPSSSSTLSSSASDAAQPIAILGLCGIYSIPDLLESFPDPFYRAFITAAFSPDPEVWKSHSPGLWGSFAESWHPVAGSASSKRIAVLAHSRDDTLIDWKQAEVMNKILQDASSSSSSSDSTTNTSTSPDLQVYILPLHGEHDSIHEEGRELARSIEDIVMKIFA